MTDAKEIPARDERSRAGRVSKSRKSNHRRPLLLTLIALGSLVIVAVAGSAWLASKATAIKSELDAATLLIPTLRENITSDDAGTASGTVTQLRAHTLAAKDAANDPIWTLAASLPGLGQNFSAVAEVARSADDVASLGLEPLVRVYGALDWQALLPSSEGTDLTPVETASPSISAAAHAVRLSAERLNQIDATKLWPQVAAPLTQARDQLQTVTGALDAAADASNIAPGMLGAGATRNYLLMIQNNAESRASGGIPGALAVLSLDKGKLSLGAQSSASAVGVMLPVVPVEAEQQQIYSGRVGKFMQDVNLTPDFPTAASTAQAMWERKTGQRVDGVISIDPVALGYVLDATGTVSIKHPELVALAAAGLPTELTGQNIVQTLLSDVYAKIEQPGLQDAYFAGVAQEIFAALADGKGNAKGLIEGLTRGTTEGRVLVWSGLPAEQSIMSKYALSGSISGPSISPAQFGVYYNDGTGAKMDYYVDRTVQLMKECARDGYEQTIVRVTSTNTAPADAGTSLPTYVTGAGAFGVPAGSVQTNIVAYGPVQSNVETAKVDGQSTNFASYEHSNRPVGTLAVRLAPGESSTVDFTFSKIVQHTEPNVVVTPTVQDVKDVILPTTSDSCGQ
ncbi:DUF4012 domain-containing protein [Pseudarthrobacter sp. NIBRBAC000502772]|uniref:DUF4012 domain-containing protein n=1 Tax=Pseudarthrobacter sp. NIBRBAC000502772 TaxID=2590775 RepID=UPI00113208AE|nr:DUF4012 domain-containing protein [Pseudarthrobacter sp. NIBRBAC000502772]QDG68093.1 DUF4012 domain-containing protein [Pseudarthrobacter sp. NIBRBAC000502772]